MSSLVAQKQLSQCGRPREVIPCFVAYPTEDLLLGSVAHVSQPETGRSHVDTVKLPSYDEALQSLMLLIERRRWTLRSLISGAVTHGTSLICRRAAQLLKAVGFTSSRSVTIIGSPNYCTYRLWAPLELIAQPLRNRGSSVGFDTWKCRIHSLIKSKWRICTNALLQQ